MNISQVSHLMRHHVIDTVMHFAAQVIDFHSNLQNEIGDLMALSVLQSHVDASFGNPLEHTQVILFRYLSLALHISALCIALAKTGSRFPRCQRLMSPVPLLFPSLIAPARQSAKAA